MIVALWTFARASAFRGRYVCVEETRRTSGRPARKERRPMKHATRNSAASPPFHVPPAPLPEYSRWSRPVD